MHGIFVACCASAGTVIRTTVAIARTKKVSSLLLRVFADLLIIDH
jgi:hypothetical protein